MSELKTRSLTAIFIALISIGAVVGGPYTFTIFILAIALGINKEIYDLFVDKNTPVQGSIFGAITIAPLVVAFSHHFKWLEFEPLSYLLALPVMVILLYLIYIRTSVAIQEKVVMAAAFSLIYISVGLMSSIQLGWLGGHYSHVLILSIIILIWINDSFAYLTGSRIGKSPLAKAISPKKTWEGSIGGGVFTVIGAIIICFITQQYSLWVWIGIGILVAIFSNVGDLLQSALKRTAGVKDSGRLLPGHGGVFDRYDSFVCVLPVIYFYLSIVL